MRFLVPSLFRRSCREDCIDCPAAEIFGVGEQVPVGVHRLGDGAVTEPGLNHLGVQVGSDQCRGVEVAQVVEPCCLRQAVCRICARLTAPIAFVFQRGWLTAHAGTGDFASAP